MSAARPGPRPSAVVGGSAAPACPAPLPASPPPRRGPAGLPPPPLSAQCWAALCPSPASAGRAASSPGGSPPHRPRQERGCFHIRRRRQWRRAKGRPPTLGGRYRPRCRGPRAAGPAGLLGSPVSGARGRGRPARPPSSRRLWAPSPFSLRFSLSLSCTGRYVGQAWVIRGGPAACQAWRRRALLYPSGWGSPAARVELLPRKAYIFLRSVHISNVH